jgi:hypothetical protein
MAFEYRVSLQIKHPSANPQDIIEGLGRMPLRYWAVGEPRRTPIGTALPGTQRETYCVFAVGEGNDGELADCLRSAVADLESAAPLFQELRATGGSINFYVSWTAGERGEVLDTKLLFSIAQLGVDLGIEPLSAR